MLEVEVWVRVNEQGEYEVGTTCEECSSRYRDSGSDTDLPDRLVCVTLKLPAPQAVQVTATLSEETSETQVTVE